MNYNNSLGLIKYSVTIGALLILLTLFASVSAFAKEATTTTNPETAQNEAFTADINMKGTVIEGAGQANAAVTVLNQAGKVVGEGNVNAKGKYAVTLKKAITTGENLTIKFAANSVEVSRVSITAPIVDVVIVNKVDETKNPDNSNHTGVAKPKPNKPAKTTKKFDHVDIKVAKGTKTTKKLTTSKVKKKVTVKAQKKTTTKKVAKTKK